MNNKYIKLKERFSNIKFQYEQEVQSQGLFKDEFDIQNLEDMEDILSLIDDKIKRITYQKGYDARRRSSKNTPQPDKVQKDKLIMRLWRR